MPNYPSDMPIRAKWAMDGATTLEEAAKMLEAKAAELRELAAAGYELDGSVEDDYGAIRKIK